MVYRFGSGLYGVCFFHLVNHAIFKALMFIAIGYLILNKFHFQDLRYLTNLINTNYLLFLLFVVRVMSLSGFPFMVGFFSKDLVIEGYYFIKLFTYYIFLLRLVFTRYYGFRLLFYLGRGKYFSFFKFTIKTFGFLRVLVLRGLILKFGK